MPRSFNRLTLDDRIKIKSMSDSGNTAKAIAEALGMHVATVYRELKSGKGSDGIYDPYYAENKTKDLRKRAGQSSKLKQYDMAEYLRECLVEREMSLSEIVTEISEKDLFPTSITEMTIYSYIDDGMIPDVTRETLNRSKTRMYGDGLLRVPKWVRKQYGFSDGDEFSLSVDKDTITFSKI